MCLRCHSASGGGPNFKRGDLEYTLAEPHREFGVHMSPDGAGLSCADCHGPDGPIDWVALGYTGRDPVAACLEATH
jgi:hypothetical protein